MSADLLVHLCPRQDWEAARQVGEYRPPSLISEGFIHCSRPEQVLGVANRFYSGIPDLVLVWIDPVRVKAEIRWEAADGQVYPHIYGPLNLEAAVDLRLFLPDRDGIFLTPPEASIRTTLSQLRMGFTRFGDLLTPQPPPGYSLRTYHPGDEGAWVELLSCGYFGLWDRARLDRMLAGGRAPMPLDGVFFVTFGELLVGTACTFLHPGTYGNIPELGWVAVHPRYRGQGLGRLACQAVLNYVKNLGFQYIYLLTEDFRLPAIKTYLELGFEPEIQDPSQPERWQALHQLIATGEDRLSPGNRQV
jgi:uncharacterized protein (DUF952 family)/GNAT superfamily N-acetyltransferase